MKKIKKVDKDMWARLDPQPPTAAYNIDINVKDHFFHRFHHQTNGLSNNLFILIIISFCTCSIVNPLFAVAALHCNAEATHPSLRLRLPHLQIAPPFIFPVFQFIPPLLQAFLFLEEESIQTSVVQPREEQFIKAFGLDRREPRGI